MNEVKINLSVEVYYLVGFQYKWNLYRWLKKYIYIEDYMMVDILIILILFIKKLFKFLQQ